MKKQLLIALTLVSAMSLPSFAAIQTKVVSRANDLKSLGTAGKSLETTMGIQQVIRASKIEAKKNDQQAFLPVNPYQSYFDQNPYAKTELKIDLDNFDMEYVLKVR